MKIKEIENKLNSGAVWTFKRKCESLKKSAKPSEALINIIYKNIVARGLRLTKNTLR